VEGRKYAGVARSEMAILKDQMKFRNLQQATRTAPPRYQGVKIVCRSVFGIDNISIFVGGGEEQQKVVYTCWCTCNFSVGIIVAITEDIDSEVKSYSVSICNKKNEYVLFEHIIASDFTQYEENQVVMVIAYNEFLYECCNGDDGATGCYPVVNELAVGDDNWRTTYRLIPLCPDFINRWYRGV